MLELVYVFNISDCESEETIESIVSNPFNAPVV